jgi:hypothetical protein
MTAWAMPLLNSLFAVPFSQPSAPHNGCRGPSSAQPGERPFADAAITMGVIATIASTYLETPSVCAGPLVDWRDEYDGLVAQLLLGGRVSKLLGGAVVGSRVGSRRSCPIGARPRIRCDTIDSNATKVIALLRGSMRGVLLTRAWQQKLLHIELLVALCPRKFVSEDAATKQGTNPAIEKFGGDRLQVARMVARKFPTATLRLSPSLART